MDSLRVDNPSQRRLYLVSPEGIQAKLLELFSSPSPVNPQAEALCLVLRLAALGTKAPRLDLTTAEDRAPHLDATMAALGMTSGRVELARILDNIIQDLCTLTKANA